jgi:hypothetical protein
MHERRKYFVFIGHAYQLHPLLAMCFMFESIDDLYCYARLCTCTSLVPRPLPRFQTAAFISVIRRLQMQRVGYALYRAQQSHALASCIYILCDYQVDIFMTE